MGKTPMGIYFPNEDTPADIRRVFQDVAESVDVALGEYTYDSGWIELPTAVLTGAWESLNTTASRTRYRKMGKKVKMNGIARRGTTGTIYTLPVGFRPRGVYPNFEVPIISTSTTELSARIRVSTVGVVEVLQTTQAERDTGIGLDPVEFFID